MKIRFFALTLAFAAAWSAAWAEDGPVCHLKRVAYLDMKTDATGLPSIPVTIDGAAKSFYVSTGFGVSGVVEKTVKELNLKTVRDKQHTLVTASGTTYLRMAIADSMQIGIVSIAKIGLMVTPDAVRGSDFEEAGTVSSDILHAFDVEFDFAAGKFSLFLPNDCGEKVVHWPYRTYGVLPFKTAETKGESASYIFESQKQWQIIVPAKLDGVDVEVEVQTGLEMSAMDLDDAKAVIPSSTRNLLTVVDPSAAPDKMTYAYPFKRLELGDFVVNNPQIHIWPIQLGTMRTLGKLKPKVTLGMPALRQLHLYISYKDRKVYFTPATMQ